MSEPTIDEMIVWFATSFQAMPAHQQLDGALMWQAIHDILKQHRGWHDINGILGHTMIDPKKALADIRIKAVSAFAERVEKRIGDSYGFGIRGESEAIQEELAAMKKEAE